MTALLYKGWLIVKRSAHWIALILLIAWGMGRFTGDFSWSLLWVALMGYLYPVLGYDADIRKEAIRLYLAMPITPADYAGSKYIGGFIAAAVTGGLTYAMERVVLQTAHTAALFDALFMLLLPLFLIALTFPLFFWLDRTGCGRLCTFRLSRL